jgi:uncharacterized membrane protein
MPFCTQCGQQARPEDLFCRNCGTRQPGSGAASGSGFRPAPAASPAMADPLAGISPRAAAILCYIPTLGWIPAVIVLAAKRFKSDHIVRFHAFQGLYLFACWLGVRWVLRPLALTLPEHFIRVDHILEGIILFVSIFMMVKAAHDQPYVLPIIGELAQRSATE